MSNHYFIGIKIPPSVARSLVEQRDSWGAGSHKRLPVAEELHITLAFIGGDPFDEINQVAETLNRVVHAAFELKITETGIFGKEDRPRVVYAGVAENELLNHLQVKIKTVLNDFELSSNEKPFVPHITLANKWNGKEVWTAIPEIKPDSFQAIEFSLFRIRPYKTPRYIAIQTYKLKDDV